MKLMLAVVNTARTHTVDTSCTAPTSCGCLLAQGVQCEVCRAAARLAALQAAQLQGCRHRLSRLHGAGHLQGELQDLCRAASWCLRGCTRQPEQSLQGGRILRSHQVRTLCPAAALQVASAAPHWAVAPCSDAGQWSCWPACGIGAAQPPGPASC